MQLIYRAGLQKAASIVEELMLHPVLFGLDLIGMRISGFCYYILSINN